MLRIWQLDPANLTPYYNLTICDALAKTGNNVHYVTSKYLYEQNLPVSDNYLVSYTYFKGLDHQWLLHSSAVRKLLRGIVYPFNHLNTLLDLRQSRPDILHIQWSRLPFLDRFFIQSTEKLNIPIVHTIHNVRSSFASDAMVARLGRVYDLVDLNILHAEANRADFLQLYPHIPREKTAVIPLIDVPYPYPIPEIEQAGLRKRFDLNKDDFVLLFFGIIRQYKGVKILLEAFGKVVSPNRRIRLLIAGRPETRQDIADLEKAGQMEGVLVHDRFIPTADLWQYFHVADVASLPYRYITQSAALIQTMSFGKPVIVTDVGAFPESVDGNGWVIPANDPDALAEAITEAVNSPPDVLHALGNRSREIVQERHSPESVARQLLASYEGLLNR